MPAQTLTLTAIPTMRARLEKVAPLLARSASTAPLTRPAPTPPLTRPIGALPRPQPTPTPLADPELVARRDRFARQNALFLRLRTLAPALFTATAPPPLAIGIHDVIVERLGLDAAAQRDLRCILGLHVARWRYQKALTVSGAVRLDLDGNPAGEVTDEHRAEAAQRLERLKAKAKAARDSVPLRPGQSRT